MTFDEMNGSFDISYNRGSVRDPMGTPELNCSNGDELVGDELVRQYASVKGLTDEEVSLIVDAIEEGNPQLRLRGPNPYPHELRLVFQRNALGRFFHDLYRRIICNRDPNQVDFRSIKSLLPH